MQRTSVEPVTIVHEIFCDRCGLRARRAAEGSDFKRMTSIGFIAEEGSIFGQGQRVEIDLCESCLRIALGQWLRVQAPEEGTVGADPAAGLPALEPERHGGEFAAADAQGLDEVFRAIAAADAEEAVAQTPSPIRTSLGADIWTTYSVYGGTGEGETTMAYVGHAEDALEAKAAFVGVFGEFFGRFSKSVEGTVRGSVTESLFSEEALQLMERMAGKATVRAHAMIHVNRS